MKKITNKIAALTAAVMAMAAMVSMSAYADEYLLDSPHISNGFETTPDTKRASIPYTVTMDENNSDERVWVYSSDDGLDHSGNYIWYIEVQRNQSDRDIRISANTINAIPYKVYWDPETQKYRRSTTYTIDYTIERDGIITYDYEYQLADSFESETDSFTMINKCNFDIDWSGEIGETSLLYNTLKDNGIEYNINDGNNEGTLAISQQCSITVSTDDDALNALTSEQKQNIYKALINANAKDNATAFFNLVMTIKPVSVPVEFVEDGTYDGGIPSIS
jgi:hypothetical protein